MVNIRHEMELFQCRVDVNPQPRSLPGRGRPEPPDDLDARNSASGVRWWTRSLDIGWTALVTWFSDV